MFPSRSSFIISESRIDGLKHGNARVNTAMIDQIGKVSYCASAFFKTNIVEEAARMLVSTTNGHMTRAYIVNSGQSAILIP